MRRWNRQHNLVGHEVQVFSNEQYGFRSDRQYAYMKYGWVVGVRNDDRRQVRVLIDSWPVNVTEWMVTR